MAHLRQCIQTFKPQDREEWALPFSVGQSLRVNTCRRCRHSLDGTRRESKLIFSLIAMKHPDNLQHDVVFTLQLYIAPRWSNPIEINVSKEYDTLYDTHTLGELNWAQCTLRLTAKNVVPSCRSSKYYPGSLLLNFGWQRRELEQCQGVSSSSYVRRRLTYRMNMYTAFMAQKKVDPVARSASSKLVDPHGWSSSCATLPDLELGKPKLTIVLTWDEHWGIIFMDYIKDLPDPKN